MIHKCPFLHLAFIKLCCMPTVDWVPVLRELVSVGLKIFALCVSCSLSLLIIGVGWLFYRPLVAVALGALALFPLFLIRSGLPAKKNEWLVNWRLSHKVLILGCSHTSEVWVTIVCRRFLPQHDLLSRVKQTFYDNTCILFTMAYCQSVFQWTLLYFR